MMDVHYIWIGGSEIPPNYLTNYQKCTQLNLYFNFKVWRNEECLQLVEEYGLMEIFTPLTFICKYNLIKYLVLHKFGGVYTDFDILWKHPFSRIMNDYEFDKTDIILTTVPPMDYLDDPFIISKPNIFGGCINYCKNKDKDKWQYDGDLYLETGELKLHKAEPFGPFSLSEWAKANMINYRCFPQKSLLDHNGFYGDHQQKNGWK
jgi:hypothetical protein